MQMWIGNLPSIELPYTARGTRNNSSTHPVHQLGDREVQLTVNIDLVSTVAECRQENAYLDTGGVECDPLWYPEWKKQAPRATGGMPGLQSHSFQAAPPHSSFPTTATTT